MHVLVVRTVTFQVLMFRGFFKCTCVEKWRRDLTKLVSFICIVAEMEHYWMLLLMEFLILKICCVHCLGNMRMIFKLTLDL